MNKKSEEITSISQVQNKIILVLILREKYSRVNFLIKV